VTPTIGEALDLLAARDPAAPAVRDDEEALTRAGLASRSRRLARVLIAAGVREGDLVPVQGGNTVPLVVAVCAIHRAGGTPLPLSPRLPADEQRAVVALADPSVLVGADPAARAARGSCSRARPPGPTRTARSPRSCRSPPGSSSSAR
jgi:bile acid-coenzyme A ligase